MDHFASPHFLFTSHQVSLRFTGRQESANDISSIIRVAAEHVVAIFSHDTADCKRRNASSALPVARHVCFFDPE
jgi:hypothetical protein